MGRATKTRTRSGVIDHQLCVAEWRRRHPVGTAASVAARIGAHVRTVENWLHGVSRPNGMWLGIIIAVYGPDFLAAVMTDPPDWLVEAGRQMERARLLEEREALAARLAALDLESG